jgi:hypothetical protein
MRWRVFTNTQKPRNREKRGPGCVQQPGTSKNAVEGVDKHPETLKMRKTRSRMCATPRNLENMKKSGPGCVQTPRNLEIAKNAVEGVCATPRYVENSKNTVQDTLCHLENAKTRKKEFLWCVQTPRNIENLKNAVLEPQKTQQSGCEANMSCNKKRKKFAAHLGCPQFRGLS